MSSATTIASGVLTLASLLAAVKCHMDAKKYGAEMKDIAADGDESMHKKKKSMMRMKYVLMISTALFGGVFIYQMMHAKAAGSSFLPSSSMAHTESEAEFARRVSDATAKLRSQLRQPPLTASPRSAYSPSHHPSSSELAARASAEISSFISNNL